MDKYICQCCGGKINRITMTCEYCGTQYEQINNNVFRIERVKLPVREFAVRTVIPSYISDPQEVAEIALHRTANELAKIIAPYCEYYRDYEPYLMQDRIQARIKLIQPINSGIGGVI